MMRGHVSILLPAWNAARTISASLRSISRQTHRDWTCVVVDDGSTDETAAIVTTHARNDGRFTLVQTPHRGLVHALNSGLSRCEGDYVARMDADDVMHRERLAMQVGALASEATLAAVGSHVRIFPRGRLTPRLLEYESWLNGLRSAQDVVRDAFVECPVAHPSLMMRGEMARLGYRDHGWPEDYDLILRALCAGHRVGVVPRRLLAWRDRPESLCRTDASYSIERFTACKAHYLAAGYLARVDEYVLWGYGATGRALRHALAACGKTPSHIVEVKASRIGQTIHGATVVPIARLGALRGRKVVVSVARAGPRQEIRNAMRDLGFAEGVDFVCAA
jgi:glycosyltransferase involved in cell wall biosynthesis